MRPSLELINTSIQVHHNIDGSNQDLGSNQYNYYNSISMIIF